MDIEQKEKKLVLIRHAQSEFNKRMKEEKDKSNFEQNVKFNRELVNAGLSIEGEQECRERREEVERMDVQLVITSPLKRCLQTTIQLFSQHPSNPHILVLPIVMENISSNCDLCSIQDVQAMTNMSQYKRVDFSVMQTYLNNGQEWQEDYLDKVVVEKVKNRMQKEDKGWLDCCLEIMKDEWPNRGLEDFYQLYSRMLQAKQQLSSVINQYNPSTTAIVTHSQFLLSFVATQFDNQHKPLNAKWFQNTEIRNFTLNI